jgi:acetolactate synthase-1/3 small subunit
MKRIISILLENESGALSRVVGLFAQRGYNIDTLTVAPTDDDTLSRLTLTTQGDDQMAEQIVKQLHKLIDTIKVVDLTVGSHIERELMLVKIKASDPEIRVELKNCVEIFRGHVVDVTASTYTVQLTGDSDKLDAFIDAVTEIGIMEVVRSGVSGISRGDKFLRV